MPKNRVKIDLISDDGSKISISLEGNLTRDKVLQILDFVDLFEQSPTIGTVQEDSNYSKFDKIQYLVRRRFPIGWFSSQEVMVAYEDALDEPIGLSTVSTYLARLTRRGLLKKTGSTVKRRYKLANFINKNDSKSRFKIRP